LKEFASSNNSATYARRGKRRGHASRREKTIENVRDRTRNNIRERGAGLEKTKRSPNTSNRAPAGKESETKKDAFFGRGQLRKLKERNTKFAKWKKGYAPDQNNKAYATTHSRERSPEKMGK